MSLFDHMNLFADLATNHRGDFEVFCRLFKDTEEAGAVPKIQLFNEQTFPRRWVKWLQDKRFVPSVFRPADIDFILPYQPLALKVASVESTYQDLINRCLEEKDLPLIVSTGGMDEDEINDLLELTESHAEVCLMHCVSLYPTPKEKINLGRLARLSEELSDTEIIIGWSSHYPVADPAAFALAWAWGATQFEVHVRHGLNFLDWAELTHDGSEENYKSWEKKTLDEQCAFTPYGLKQIRSILEDLPVLEGSDDYAGPDRDFVVEHRKRWQR